MLVLVLVLPLAPPPQPPLKSLRQPLRLRLVVEPARKPKYTLAELLAASDYANAGPTDEDKAWIDAPATGRELL